MKTNDQASSRKQFEKYGIERARARQEPGGGGKHHSKSIIRHRSLPQLYRELSRLLAGNWWAFSGSLAILSVVTLLKLIPPVATKLAIDNVLLGRPLPTWLPAWLPVPADPKQRLVELVAVVFMVALLGMVLGIWTRWLATVISKRLQVSVRHTVFEHAARLPLHRVYQLKAGGAASLLRDDAGGVGELIFSMFYNPWRALIQFAGGLIVLLWVDWRMLICAMVLMPAVFVSSRLWNRFLRPLYRDVRSQRQEVDARAAEAFGGMRVVRAFGRQRRESGRFVRGNHVMVRLELMAWWWTRIVELLWELVLPAASGLLMLYGGLRVLDGHLSPGDLMMFLVYLGMLVDPITTIASSMNQVQGNLAGFDRVLDILAEPREMELVGGESTGTGSKIRKREVAGRISIEGVSFQYPGTQATVLHDISLEVAPGETVALVGRSGSGKTTLCNLVARFYDPTSGTIRLDGRDIRSIDVEDFRHLLGIVEQDVFLFDGTIADNIAYASRGASQSEIEHAARVANAAGFIEAFADGYQTMIGERGVRMSGGQRQRLAIARAVLADARILILDEATSNLDSESERLIQSSLATVLKNRTSFVIAHRLSTVRQANKILVMDSGRIVEMGDHEALMARGGRYAEMVALQNIDS